MTAAPSTKFWNGVPPTAAEIQAADEISSELGIDVNVEAAISGGGVTRSVLVYNEPPGMTLLDVANLYHAVSRKGPVWVLTPKYELDLNGYCAAFLPNGAAGPDVVWANLKRWIDTQRQAGVSQSHFYRDALVEFLPIERPGLAKGNVKVDYGFGFGGGFKADQGDYYGTGDDGVFINVGEGDDGKWYWSGTVDCEKGGYVDTLWVDEGPFDSEKEAREAGGLRARDWLAESGIDTSSSDVDPELEAAREQGQRDKAEGKSNWGRALYPVRYDLQRAYDEGYQGMSMQAAAISTMSNDEIDQLYTSIDSNVSGAPDAKARAAIRPLIGDLAVEVGRVADDWAITTYPGASQDDLDTFYEVMDDGGLFYAWMGLQGHGVGLVDHFRSSLIDAPGKRPGLTTGFDGQALARALDADAGVRRVTSALELELTNQCYEQAGGITPGATFVWLKDADDGSYAATDTFKVEKVDLDNDEFITTDGVSLKLDYGRDGYLAEVDDNVGDSDDDEPGIDELQAAYDAGQAAPAGASAKAWAAKHPDWSDHPGIREAFSLGNYDWWGGGFGGAPKRKRKIVDVVDGMPRVALSSRRASDLDLDPDESDAFITWDGIRGQYDVGVDGKHIGAAGSIDEAEEMLEEYFQTTGYYPTVWLDDTGRGLPNTHSWNSDVVRERIEDRAREIWLWSLDDQHEGTYTGLDIAEAEEEANNIDGYLTDESDNGRIIYDARPFQGRDVRPPIGDWWLVVAGGGVVVNDSGSAHRLAPDEMFEVVDFDDDWVYVHNGINDYEIPRDEWGDLVRSGDIETTNAPAVAGILFIDGSTGSDYEVLRSVATGGKGGQSTSGTVHADLDDALADAKTQKPLMSEIWVLEPPRGWRPVPLPRTINRRGTQWRATVGGTDDRGYPFGPGASVDVDDDNGRYVFANPNGRGGWDYIFSKDDFEDLIDRGVLVPGASAPSKQQPDDEQERLRRFLFPRRQWEQPRPTTPAAPEPEVPPPPDDESKRHSRRSHGTTVALVDVRSGGSVRGFAGSAGPARVVRYAVAPSQLHSGNTYKIILPSGSLQRLRFVSQRLGAMPANTYGRLDELKEAIDDLVDEASAAASKPQEYVVPAWAQQQFDEAVDGLERARFSDPSLRGGVWDTVVDLRLELWSANHKALDDIRASDAYNGSGEFDSPSDDLSRQEVLLFQDQLSENAEIELDEPDEMYDYITVVVGGQPPSELMYDGDEWQLVRSWTTTGSECWMCSPDNNEPVPEGQECPLCENTSESASGVRHTVDTAHLYEAVYRRFNGDIKELLDDVDKLWDADTGAWVFSAWSPLIPLQALGARGRSGYVPDVAAKFAPDAVKRVLRQAAGEQAGIARKQVESAFKEQGLPPPTTELADDGELVVTQPDPEVAEILAGLQAQAENGGAVTEADLPDIETVKAHLERAEDADSWVRATGPQSQLKSLVFWSESLAAMGEPDIISPATELFVLILEYPEREGVYSAKYSSDFYVGMWPYPWRVERYEEVPIGVADEYVVRGRSSLDQLEPYRHIVLNQGPGGELPETEPGRSDEIDEAARADAEAYVAGGTVIDSAVRFRAFDPPLDVDEERQYRRLRDSYIIQLEQSRSLPMDQPRPGPGLAPGLYEYAVEPEKVEVMQPARRTTVMPSQPIGPWTIKAQAMVPEYWDTEWYEVSHDHGSTTWLPADLDPGAQTNSDLQDYVDGDVDYPDDPPTKIKGVGTRLTMPGHLDSTDWIIYDTERDARKGWITGDNAYESIHPDTGESLEDDNVDEGTLEELAAEFPELYEFLGLDLDPAKLAPEDALRWAIDQGWDDGTAGRPMRQDMPNKDLQQAYERAFGRAKGLIAPHTKPRVVPDGAGGWKTAATAVPAGMPRRFRYTKHREDIMWHEGADEPDRDAYEVGSADGVSVWDIIDEIRAISPESSRGPCWYSADVQHDWAKGGQEYVESVCIESADGSSLTQEHFDWIDRQVRGEDPPAAGPYGMAGDVGNSDYIVLQAPDGDWRAFEIDRDRRGLRGAAGPDRKTKQEAIEDAHQADKTSRQRGRGGRDWAKRFPPRGVHVRDNQGNEEWVDYRRNRDDLERQRQRDFFFPHKRSVTCNR